MAGGKAFQKLSSLETVVPVYSIGRYAGCSFVPSVVLENQQDAQHPKFGSCRKLIDLRNSAAHCKRTESINLFAGLKGAMPATSISCRSSGHLAHASLPSRAVALIDNTVSSRSGCLLQYAHTEMSRLFVIVDAEFI